MRILSALLFLLCSCDSISVNYSLGKCMEHSWAYSGIYKVMKRNKTRVTLEEVSSRKEIVITAMDKGWSEVECP